MDFRKTDLVGVFIVVTKSHEDSRGYFTEIFRQDIFQQHVGEFSFVQDNQSLSKQAGTVRGLHFQLEPRAQGKLIRCIAGGLLDVAVDIRLGSPSYGRHIAVELTAENRKQLWIPPGFAHGFCTLENDTIAGYKVTDFHDVDLNRGISWRDPVFAINWPVADQQAILSEKDQRLPNLEEMPAPFRIDSWSMTAR